VTQYLLPPLSFDRLFTIAEIDSFLELYQRPHATEFELHEFLKQNPKFLFALGAYDAAISECQFSTRSSVLPANLRLDFLLRNTRGIWDIVEIKKSAISGNSLVVGKPERRRFSVEIEDALAQIRTYLNVLEHPEVKESFEKAKIFLDQPQAWLLIGRDNDFVGERRALEKELPHSVRIVTYDELAEFAKQRVLIVTRSILMPSIPIYGGELVFGEVELVAAAECLLTVAKGESPVAVIVDLLTKPFKALLGKELTEKDLGDLRSYISRLRQKWDCKNLHLFLRPAEHGNPSAVHLDRLILEAETQLFLHLSSLAKTELTIGERVIISRGPLQGLEGIISAKRSADRIIVTIQLLNKGVSVDVSALDAARKVGV
jgi:hypothetical protein